MIQFILKKILNNRWLSLSLFIGAVIFIGIMTMLPILRRGALDKLVLSGFEDYAKSTDTFPAVIAKSGSTGNAKQVDSALGEIDKCELAWKNKLKISSVAYQRIVWVEANNYTTDLGSNRRSMKITYLDDFDNICDIVKSYDGEIPDDCKAAYISESVMDSLNLSVGETLTFGNADAGHTFNYMIVGIVKESDESRYVWNERLSDMEGTIFTDKEGLDAFSAFQSPDAIYYKTACMLDYRDIVSEKAESFKKKLQALQKDDKSFSENITGTLISYEKGKGFINIIFISSMLLIMLLLFMFVLLVSGRIVRDETEEMAVLRSRGISRGKIVSIYMLRAGIISAVAAPVGLILGLLMSYMAGSTNDFLTFGKKDLSGYTFNAEVPFYLAAAIVLLVICMTIPVIKRSGNTIINVRAERMKIKVIPFWQKYFLDVVLMAVSGYFLYRFKKQQGTMGMDMINGRSVDPVLFLLASIFILALGLLLIRVIYLIASLIFRAGEKAWKPAAYAGFMQVIRGGGISGVISVFIVLTIALGIYEANLARTINENNTDRVSYDDAADYVLMEKWTMKVTMPASETWIWNYNEPDYGKMLKMVDDGLMENVTRVIRDDNTKIYAKSKTFDKCNLYGIDTKEFGLTSDLDRKLTEEHWYNYLNALASNPKGVIISENLADETGLEVGDTIRYSRFHPLTVYKSKEIAQDTGEVVAIVPAWPGFTQYSYESGNDGKVTVKENYLVVANRARVQQTFGLMPYEVWMKKAKDTNHSKLRDYLEQNSVRYVSLTDREEDIRRMKDSAEIQITNGLFTISFLVSLLICGIGFLIYWITAIKGRQHLFGIYRAMGLSMNEIIAMLAEEHFFGSLLTGVAGVVSGLLASYLFNDLIAIIYLPEMHNVPLTTFISYKDVLKPVMVFLLILMAALFIIIRILSRMNISESLKMGDD